MSEKLSRRKTLATLGGALAGLFALPAAKAGKATVQSFLVKSGAPAGYDPTKHKWRMALDISKCIGCGSCVQACKTENNIPESVAYFRTWIERYIIKKPEPGAGESRGETVVDSPNGGLKGFPPSMVPREEILKAFFVPKLCNQCEDSPCVQACPVGATFDSPDGVVLVDPSYCVGCGFCIQACPYGCRFMNPETKTADKCTLCYHRITRGLQPACVEVCPTGCRIFGDLKDSSPDNPIRKFIEQNTVQTLKPHLGTNPQTFYANMDKEVR
jgi:tetrathionate reductase subunit B